MVMLRMGSVSLSFLGTANSLKKISRLFAVSSICREKTSDSYVHILPQLPSDTVETNSLLGWRELPDWEGLTPERCFNAISKCAVLLEQEVVSHCDSLKGRKDLTFHDVFSPIEEGLTQLMTVSNNVKNLRYSRCSDALRIVYEGAAGHARRVYSEILSNEDLYDALKSIDAESLTENEKRILDITISRCRTAGAHLAPTELTRLRRFESQVFSKELRFRYNTLITSYKFRHNIEKVSSLIELPRDILIYMAEDKENPMDGPWVVTLQEPLYSQFMAHCSDRLIRWNTWRAYINRASIDHKPARQSNIILLNDIRGLRQVYAKQFKSANLSELRAADSCVGGLPSAVDMIDSLRDKHLPQATEEMARLQSYAESIGFEGKLELWDIDYFSRRYKFDTFSIDHSLAAEYFPLPQVLHKMFQLVGHLFGVEIKEASRDVPKWTRHLLFYNVIDSESKKLIGSFYFDPYARPTEKYPAEKSFLGRARKESLEVPALGYLYLNLYPPMYSDRPPLLRYSDVQNLFHSFGSLIHKVLIADTNLILNTVNADFISPYYTGRLLRALTHRPHMIHYLSEHFSSGQPLSHDDCQLLANERHPLGAHNIMYQVYLSTFDLELHIHSQLYVHWGPVMKRLFEQHFPYLSYYEDDDFAPCSWSTIFGSDELAGMYYTKLAGVSFIKDLVKPFIKHNLFSPEVGMIGRRYRNTMMKYLGSPLAHRQALSLFLDTTATTPNFSATHSHDTAAHNIADPDHALQREYVEETDFDELRYFSGTETTYGN